MDHGTSSGSPYISVVLLTEMAEMLFQGTFCEDVWTCKISALYLLYFESYESFCGVFSDFH